MRQYALSPRSPRYTHLLTVAPTRTGKGTGAIIPNLLDAERSVLCIDPKGENASVTVRRRRRFSPRMAAVMERSDFGFAELKQRACTLFLVLPPDRLDADARWLRLLVA